MKLSTLAEVIRAKASESALSHDASTSSALQVSFSFRENTANKVLIGACAGADIDYTFPLISGTNPSAAPYVENIVRINESKGLYISDSSHVFRKAREMLVYYYPKTVHKPADDAETTNEEPWMEIFLAVSGADDDICKIIEEEIIETTVEFFGEEHFRFEVYY